MAEKRKPAGKSAAAKAKDGKPAGGSTKARAARNTKARRKSTATSGKTADRANKIAKRAKVAGATGRHLGAVKQSLRDSMIVARDAQGIRHYVIAAEAGVSERTVRDVLAKVRAVPSPIDRTPMQLLEGIARGFELAVGDFEAMATAYVASDPNAAIRAKRAAIEARRAYAELLSVVGKLPTDLELFRAEAEMMRMAGAMAEAMERVLAGELSVEEAHALFERLSQPESAAVDGSVVAELGPGE